MILSIPIKYKKSIATIIATTKGLFGILNSPKKQTKKFKFTTMIPVAVKFFQNCSNKTKQNDTRV